MATMWEQVVLGLVVPEASDGCSVGSSGDRGTAVFAPAKMNWASTRMYNTLKRTILYVQYGLILGICGLLDALWGEQ